MRNINEEDIISVSEYDEQGNLIHYKRWDGEEKWYDKNGRLTRIRYSNWKEEVFKYDIK